MKVHLLILSFWIAPLALAGVEAPTDLAALAKNGPAITLTEMGSPLSPAPCQGSQLTLIPLASTAAVRGCQGDAQVEKQLVLTATQLGKVKKVLAQWKVLPVPAQAYNSPCPAFDGGGFSAQAIGAFGLENYSSMACENQIPDGILEFDVDAVEAYTKLIEELIAVP